MLEKQHAHLVKPRNCEAFLGAFLGTGNPFSNIYSWITSSNLLRWNTESESEISILPLLTENRLVTMKSHISSPPLLPPHQQKLLPLPHEQSLLPLPRQQSRLRQLLRPGAGQITTLFLIILFISTPPLRTFSGVFSTPLNGGRDCSFLPFGKEFGDEIVETKDSFKEISLENSLTIYGEEYSSIVVRNDFYKLRPV